MRSPRGHRRAALLLTVLAVAGCAGLALLLARPPSQARAARAKASRISSQSCSGGGFGASVFGVGRGTKLLSETNLQICVTGQLTVTFAGDPATSCAAHGLCGYAGTETWEPAGLGDLSVSTYDHRGRRFDEATMLLGVPESPVQSAVQRTLATGTTAACSDEAQSDAGFFSLPVSGRRVRVGFTGSDAPVLGTRCAGPLDADVAAALPSRTVALSRILHGRDTIDLTSSRHFAAHGLAGTVRSTIMLRLGRPHRSSSSNGSSATPPPGVKPSRLATVNYRVTHVGGSAIATVRGSPLAAVCGPFDACGLQGTIDVRPGTTSSGFVGLIATAPLGRPKPDLLAALGVGRGNPSGIAVEGGGDASGHGQVTAGLTQPGGACRDQVALRQVELELRKRANRLVVSLSPGGSEADPLRTRCPGPDLGSHEQLTTASLPLSVLRHPTFTVKLGGGTFRNGPYRLTTRSTLTVTLRRTKVRTQIVPFAASAR